MKKYKDLVKQSLEQSQNFTKQNIMLLEIVNENYRLQIKNLENEIKDNETIINNQMAKDNKNINIINHGNNCVIGEKIEAIKATSLTSTNAVTTNDNATLNFSKN